MGRGAQTNSSNGLLFGPRNKSVITISKEEQEHLDFLEEVQAVKKQGGSVRIPKDKSAKDWSEQWFDKDMNFHRNNGPAVTHKQGGAMTFIWYQNDRKHREDGPAVVSPFGEQWFLNGVKYQTKAEWQAAKDNQ